MLTVTDISELKADNKRESENVYERRLRERGEITLSKVLRLRIRWS